MKKWASLHVMEWHFVVLEHLFQNQNTAFSLKDTKCALFLNTVQKKKPMSVSSRFQVVCTNLENV